MMHYECEITYVRFVFEDGSNGILIRYLGKEDGWLEMIHPRVNISRCLQRTY